ncbi:hypothetical protein [Chitinophaga nivalis]|uniref:Uncharacterized protein n=1 Tax=Chitinophaga nivalis TaxID=2991709 RepID=A0ABT3IFX0_9BACT|nr:hypothetical protein [Chitinophaga nivalis]MCW3467458.1 hypothetical protein [Chitinophaga nivalis]MCW3482850.1 hypothetical protein [Chitinophaga nivalis]
MGVSYRKEDLLEKLIREAGEALSKAGLQKSAPALQEMDRAMNEVLAAESDLMLQDVTHATMEDFQAYLRDNHLHTSTLELLAAVLQTQSELSKALYIYDFIYSRRATVSFQLLQQRALLRKRIGE